MLFPQVLSLSLFCPRTALPHPLPLQRKLQNAMKAPLSVLQAQLTKINIFNCPRNQQNIVFSNTRSLLSLHSVLENTSFHKGQNNFINSLNKDGFGCAVWFPVRFGLQRPSCPLNSKHRTHSIRLTRLYKLEQFQTNVNGLHSSDCTEVFTGHRKGLDKIQTTHFAVKPLKGSFLASLKVFQMPRQWRPSLWRCCF